MEQRRLTYSRVTLSVVVAVVVVAAAAADAGAVLLLQQTSPWRVRRREQ
jgi:hypothetical protein